MNLPVTFAQISTVVTLSLFLLTACSDGSDNTNWVKYETPGGAAICVNESALFLKELSKDGELASAEFIVKTPGGRELLGRYTPHKYLAGPGYKKSRAQQHDAISNRGLSADAVHKNFYGVRSGFELQHLTLYHSKNYQYSRAWFLTNQAVSCAYVAEGKVPCHAFFEVNTDRIKVDLPYKMLGNYNTLENILKQSYFREGNACD